MVLVRNLPKSVFQILFIGLLALCGTVQAQTTGALTSPAYADYNTFLSMTNILELAAAGEKTIDLNLRVYRSDGVLLSRLNFSLTPGSQRDVILNDVPGVRADSYGVVEIEFSPSDAELVGRSSFYKQNPDGNFSFAFSRELVEPHDETSYVVSNSVDPQGRRFIVPNWLQVVNVANQTETFDVTLYDQAGNTVSTRTISLLPFQRFDSSAGHEQGSGVYLSQISPRGTSARYIAAVTRYGSNVSPGTDPTEFAFAFALNSRVPEVGDQYTITSNLRGTVNSSDPACFRQQNWIEVVNVTNAAVNPTLTFRDSSGAQIGTSIITLGPKAQFHFNGAILLDENDLGSVRVQSNTPNALIVQSTAYNQNCRNDLIQTAYVLPAVSLVQSPLYGSFNRFLEMQNDMIVVNITGESRPLRIDVAAEGQEINRVNDTLISQSTRLFDINDNSVFSTVPDTYGTLTLDSLETTSFFAYLLRTRLNPNGTVDFVNPTQFR